MGTWGSALEYMANNIAAVDIRLAKRDGGFHNGNSGKVQ